MELKKRLTRLSKDFNPQIEASPSAKKIAQLIKSLEEVVSYEQEKLDRTAERIAAGEPTVGQKVDDRIKKEQADVKERQEAEAKQNADDQAEAHEERNREHRERTGSTVLDDAGKVPPAVAKKKAAKKKKKKASKKKK